MKNKLLSDAVKQAALKPEVNLKPPTHEYIGDGNVTVANSFTAEDYLFGNPDIPQANTGPFHQYQYIDDVLYYQNPYNFEWSKAKSLNELKQKNVLRISKNKHD
jgi:hypothetical protein